MQLLKPCVVLWASLLVLMPSGAHAAVMLKNSMSTDIKSVFCIGKNGEKLPVADGVPKRSSRSVPAGRFSEHSCARVGVTVQTGAGWQYYVEPEAGMFRELEFSFDAAGQYETRKYPSLLITLQGGDSSVYPAGVPMATVAGLLRKGLDQTSWKACALPGYESLKDAGIFAVSFADQSWSLGRQGMRFDGKNSTLETLSMFAPFANTTLGAGFDELKKNGWLPLVLEANGQTNVFNAQGAALAPQGKLVEGPQTDEDAWQAFEALFVNNDDSTGKTMRVVFGSEGLTLVMSLNLDDALAEITLARVPAAAARP